MKPLRTYMGRPCRHGHGGERYVRTGGCVECKRASVERYQESDEALRVRIRAFFEANPHEMLSRRDVAVKFGITEHRASVELSRLKAEGLLKHTYVWSVDAACD